MKKGKKTVGSLRQLQIEILLGEIVDSCIKYAGDSYDDFGRDMVKILREYELVNYGYDKN